MKKQQDKTVNNWTIQKRGEIVLLLLILLLCVLIGRMFYLGIVARDEVIEWGRSRIWQNGSIPPVRGRILSSDGVVLAYSERTFELRFRRVKKLRQAEFERLKECVRGIVPRADFSGLVWTKNLNADEVVMLSSLKRRYPELRLNSVLKRRSVAESEPMMAKIIGKVIRRKDRSRHGISGLEQKYDSELSGRSGRYEVRFDRYGNWITESYKELIAPRQGHDVVLEQSYAELRSQAERMMSTAGKNEKLPDDAENQNEESDEAEEKIIFKKETESKRK